MQIFYQNAALNYSRVLAAPNAEAQLFCTSYFFARDSTDFFWLRLILFPNYRKFD